MGKATLLVAATMGTLALGCSYDFASEGPLGAGGKADDVTGCANGGGVVHDGDYDINTADDLVLMSGLTQITGTVEVRWKFRGTDLVGLESLRCVGALVVDDNDTLTSLTGLDNLTSAGSLHIFSNDVLATFGLGALDEVYEVFAFGVVDNPELPCADVQAVYDGLSIAPDELMLNGNQGTCR